MALEPSLQPLNHVLQLPLHDDIQRLLLVVVGILIFFTLLFNIWKKIAPKKFLDVMIARTYSWWAISVLYVLFVCIESKLAYIGFALLSFFALKELIQHFPKRKKDFSSRFWCYLAIPIQFYLAYKGHFILFLIFIPVFMFLILSISSVLQQEVEGITRTFSYYHWALVLTVFSISHLAYILSLPKIPDYDVGPEGLLLYLVFLCQFNDVLQFLWGKALGKRQISRNISPEKTWEGYLGALITTMGLAYFFRFLTPFSPSQALMSGFVIATAGLFGDLNVSAIKREWGLKDMGQSIPGHGGILDRLDSLSFASLVFFHLTYYWYFL